LGREITKTVQNTVFQPNILILQKSALYLHDKNHLYEKTSTPYNHNPFNLNGFR